MDRKIFALIRTIIVSTLFLTLWLWLLPRVIVGPAAYADSRLAGWIIGLAGLAIGIWCVVEFAWRGLGTPAPFDPPRKLVVTGPYRFVRNPMYVGFFVAIIGEAIAFPHLTRFMLIMLVTLWIATTIFIVVYEEPTLRRMFGDEYGQYCSHVRRWVPRLTPFDNPGIAALH